ncbi:sphingosine kinase 2 isoform X2 [Hyalella azteca]|uniref:Sphingosine kinase 2 isoform X2 n=1 Tax=Hyalella azteca TaxID=294128 RepID=A0A8B7N490_HYAAZ|nr:sphingosine kinase 2 isoform X2 [Hyalella azteca]
MAHVVSKKLLATDDALEQVLPLCVSKGGFRLARVKLDHDGIVVNFVLPDGVPIKNSSENGRNHSSEKILLKAPEIVGSCVTRSTESISKSVFLKIFAYPIDESKRNPSRRRISITMEFETQPTMEENYHHAMKWANFVHDMLQPDTPIFGSPGMSSTDKLLVLVNPNSGPGKAYQIFRKQVAPVLSDSGVAYDVIITQRANHAHDLMKTLDLQKYKAVAVVAGDGLLYEVYNGLGCRSDWMSALGLPVCIIPGGSGNGLAKSLAYWRKDPELKRPRSQCLISALNLVRGTPKPMDLILIHSHSGKRYISFLSFGLGLLTDIDIQSERLRILGEARFTLWGIGKVMVQRRYSVTISFKRASGIKRDELKKSASQSELQSQTCESRRPNLQHSISCHAPHPEDPPSPSTPDEDDVPNEFPGNPEVEDNDDSSSFPLGHSRDEVELGRDALDESLWNKKTSTRKADYSHLLQKGGADAACPFSDPVPEDWETIKGEFLLVYVVYQSHISSSVMMIPEAAPDDGIMWLILMPGSMSRPAIAKVLLQLDNGMYARVPGVRLIPVTGVRIVPHDTQGLLTIDGESIPFEPIHAQVLPGLARVLVR